MTQVHIVAFAGSTRKDSFNKKLIKIAAAAAEQAGAKVTLLDIADYPMPLYDGDMEKENGLPEQARAFKNTLASADGFLIASPEYNSSISGVLKNIIDWTSRPDGANDTSLSAYAGKYAGIMAAAPGALGGLRGLYPLREILQNISVTVIPAMQAVSQAGSAFDDNGQLKDEKTSASVAKIATNLVDVLKKVKASA